MKNTKIICLFLLFLSFISCEQGMLPQNPGNNQQKEKEQEQIVLSVQINSPAGDERSATVVVPENVKYTVEATKGSAYFSASTPDEDNYYLLGLNEDGEWTVSVKGYFSEKQIFAGSNTVKVTGNGKYFVTVNVYFLEDDTIGTGSANLSMDVSATTISKLVVSDADALDGTYEASNGIIQLNKSGIKTGSYNALFAFYDSKDALIVRFRESVNVKSNMTTNKWIKSKASVYLVEDEERGVTTFVLTPEIIVNIVSSQFYVSSSGSDSGSGNISSPFASVQAAVNRCFALNDIDGENNVYTIYVDGEIGTATSSTVINQNDYTNPIVLSLIGESEDAKILGDVTVTATELLVQNVGVGGSVYLSGKEITLAGSTKIGTKIQFDSENLFVNAELLTQAKVAVITFADTVINSYVRNSVIVKPETTALSADDIRRFSVVNDNFVLSYDADTAFGVLQYSTGTIFDLPLYQLSIELSQSDFTISSKTGNISFDAIAAIKNYPATYSPKITNISCKLFSGSVEFSLSEEGFEATENDLEWKKTISAENLTAGTYKLLISVETDSGVYSTSSIIKVEEV